jgi:hypothetical protein
MNEWEMRVSQRELHRLHIVRLTLERARECAQRGKAFGDLGAPDETAKAKNERARCWGSGSRQPGQVGVE